MKCSGEKRHELLCEIGKALNVGDLDKAELIGKELKKYEEPAVRKGYFDLAKYEVFEHESQLSKLTTTVYRVTHMSGHSYFTTVKEFAKVNGLNIVDSYHALMCLKDSTIEPIAEVFNEVINQVVFVNQGRKIIEHGFYLDIAFNYGIHFEDLNDLIEDKLPLKLNGTLYKFSYADGKEN